MRRVALPLLLLVALLASTAPTQGLAQLELPHLAKMNPTDPRLQLAPGLVADTLFREDELIRLPDGRLAPPRDDFDFLAITPLDAETTRVVLWTNHETAEDHPTHPRGGAATCMTLERTPSGNWIRPANDTARSIDFGPVGGTWNNCLGTSTPWGTVLTSEEYEPASNAEVWNRPFRDTSDFDGRPRYLNYGWMVEVDPISGAVMGKRHAMGRFSHEGALFTDPGTVYMMDDEAPGLLFKFVADVPGNLSRGILYAYRQGKDARTSGSWVALPQDFESLANARNVALSMGATIFIRLEDAVQMADGRILITETGRDPAKLGAAKGVGGQLAHHLRALPSPDGGQTLDDRYGRILVFDPKTNIILPFLEGGYSSDSSLHLANPDNLGLHPDGVSLIIHEDINAPTPDRVPPGTPAKTYQNELFYLNLAPYQNMPANPSLDNLVRLAKIPHGAESTGGLFSPDGGTYILNLQHPNDNNPSPYHLNLTLGLRGW